MYLAVMVVHVVVALMLICLVFMQHGKGADAGVFSVDSSSSNYQNMGMTKFIALLALSFFITSLALGFLSSHNQTRIVQVAQESA